MTWSASSREAMMQTGAMFGRQFTGIGWLIVDCNSDTSLPNPLWSVSLIDRWKAFICTVNLKQQSQNKNIITKKKLHFSIQGHVNRSISSCDLSKSDLAEKNFPQHTTEYILSNLPFKIVIFALANSFIGPSCYLKNVINKRQPILSTTVRPGPW